MTHFSVSSIFLLTLLRIRLRLSGSCSRGPDPRRVGTGGAGRCRLHWGLGGGHCSCAASCWHWPSLPTSGLAVSSIVAVGLSALFLLPVGGCTLHVWTGRGEDGYLRQGWLTVALAPMFPSCPWDYPEGLSSLRPAPWSPPSVPGGTVLHLSAGFMVSGLFLTLESKPASP